MSTEEQEAPTLDARRHAFRSDLADKSLEGMVDAEKFVSGEGGQIVRATLPLRRTPDPALGFDTEGIFGERLKVFDFNNGWAWVQLEYDGYVGYAPADAVSNALYAATHRVQAMGTFVYAEADFKTAPRLHLPMNSQVAVREENANFSELQTGGFVYTRHITPTDRPARDFVEVATRFVGTPYLWGGRTRIGLDCSGLVQTALQAAGVRAPRDTDMQQAELGFAVDFDADLTNLQRADLVFWDRHVAIMLDGVMMVHANAHHMAVAIEPLPEAAERIARTGGGKIMSVRRLRP